MNFADAVSAHIQWKAKLSAFLSHPDGSMDAANASLDNKCPLGQWIVREGAKYSTLPEYAKLKLEHTHFHKAVGNVIRRAASGQKVAEETALGSHSEFGTASNAVVSAIMAMESKAKLAKGKGV